MRTAILILALVVVGLAVSILLLPPPPIEREGPVFAVGRLISDAVKGEEVQYADPEGNRVLWRVESILGGGPDHPPWKRIRRERRDAAERLLSVQSYEHYPTIHFLFPLTAPEEPDGYDRVWVWQRIRRDAIDVGGKRRAVWRVDGVDPGAPPDDDTFVAWLDETVPVFGLLKWQHRGKTWTLVGSKGGE
jgi:hypothetical protein